MMGGVEFIKMRSPEPRPGFRGKVVWAGSPLVPAEQDISSGAMHRRIACRYIIHPGMFFQNVTGWSAARIYSFWGDGSMRSRLLAVFVLAALAVCTGIVSANLIANSGFETPVVSGSWQIFTTVPGWTLNDGELEYQTQSTIGLLPYEGTQYAELDPNYNVRISQVIGVTGGTSYDVSFAQSCRPDDRSLPSTLGVYWDGTLLGRTTCDRSQADSRTWVAYSYSVTPASDGTATIMFADEGVSDSYGVLLDDVKVETATIPVPEFPTAYVPVSFIAGLLAIVLIIRLRTR